MTSKYQIKRWDAIIIGNSITKVPIIYIEPDIDFLNFVESSNYAVMCNITDTNTVYDNRPIPATVDKGAFIPDCRPNFYEKNGYYVITLAGATWNGYPKSDSLGYVSFLNSSEVKNKIASENTITEPTEITQVESFTLPKETLSDEPSGSKSIFDLKFILLVIGAIFLTILLVYLIFFTNKK